MAKKSKSSKQTAEQKEETQKNSIQCNVDKSFSIPKDLADDLVIFKMTDYSSPREKDPTKQTKFNTSIKKMSEHNFVQSFKSNFTNNGAFENISSAEEIYRIMKNIDEDTIKERYEYALIGTQGKVASVKNAKVKSLLERAQQLRLNGGNQVVTLDDFIHVPGLEDVDVNNLPDNV